MSWLRRFASVGLLFPLVPLVVWSCSSDDSPGDQPAVDSGVVDVGTDTNVRVDTTPPEDTGPVIHCALDNGTDPVALCVQKVIFQQWHEAAFIKDLGVAESWDSTTFLPDKSGSGEIFHSIVDDVGYASVLARYRISALRYGDTELSYLTDPDLAAIATRIKAELVDVPSDNLAELYVALRAAATSYRTLGLDQAADFDAEADKVGAAIFATYHPLSAPAPGDAGDAGSDATDATSSDATDASADALAPIGDGILGTATSGGGYAYAPAEVVTGGYALLDMAMRHATDKANAYAWQRAAVSAIEHVHARARESSTGMYYAAMIATDGASADTLPSTPTPPTPNDALLADVQATIALSLSRAQELVSKNASAFNAIPSYPFDAHAAEAIASSNGAHSLWDEAGSKGYFEGYVPSTSAMITTKPTRANARFLAALHRVQSTVGTSLASQLKPLRVVLTARVPEHTSLLSVLPDQASFLERAPASFDFGTTTATPRERSYFSRDDAAVLDGLWEQWFALPF